MRVYEYAKKMSLSSREVLVQLKKNGIDLPSHMALLSEDALEALEKWQSSSKKIQHASEESDNKTIKNDSIKPVDDSRVFVDKKKRSFTKTPSPSRFDPFRHSRETVVTKSSVDNIVIAGEMSVQNVANVLRKSVHEVIFVLLKSGLVRNVNAQLSVKDIQQLGERFGVVVEVKKAASRDMVQPRDCTADGKDNRLPVVVVMGHVDHGKTTLLDYLRKSNVANNEKGGITQHLGAYEVVVGKQRLIFLDTPGHEAFSYMRRRGAQITDLAIIIIAANDGVKPQTIEAIDLAKQAGVPVVVAINKIDKIDTISSSSQLDALKTQLSQHGLTPEEWGGDTVCVPISAKTGQGVDDLLEMLLLHADLLDLKTTINAAARAFILETKLVKGHGWVATVICKKGTLRCGDFFICGGSTGKVKLLIDSYGKPVEFIGPSTPVQVVGFDNTALLGDWLDVVPIDRYLQAKSQRVQKRSYKFISRIVAPTEKQKVIRILFKADTHGSCQALIGAINKLSNAKKRSSVVIELMGCAVGSVTEGDVLQALETGAHLFGLHVKTGRKAAIFAKEKNITITLYDIIYHLVEDIEAMVKAERKKVVRLVERGVAEVLKVFPIKNQKVIAGCLIKEGIVRPGDKVVCIRGRKEVGSGKIISLQRDKKVVAEVREGHDCGFLTDEFHDWHVGDIVNIFAYVSESGE